jgi:hypothetical protein
MDTAGHVSGAPPRRRDRPGRRAYPAPDCRGGPDGVSPAPWNPWIRFHLDYIDGRVRAQESGLHAGPMKKF